MPRFLEDTTPHDLKYIQDLSDEFTNYYAQLILNVFNGVALNLGVVNPDMLGVRSPRELRLEKGFLSGMSALGKRIHGYIGRKLKKTPFQPFKIKGLKLYRKDKPMTYQEWRDFESQVLEYIRPYVDGLGEEMAVKGVLLAMASSEMEKQGRAVKQYGKVSYEQLEKEMFNGYVPDSMVSAQERFDITREVDRAIQLGYTQAADHMTNIEDNLRTAVKEQVQAAHRIGKTPMELASDLYWMKDDKPELKKFTAEIVMRDWRRVAHTELAYVHERGKIAQYEDKARKSIDNPEEAIYLVFNGTGRCDWCEPRQGEIVRLIPLEVVGNERDDTLSSRGINDPHTNIAVWQGKNNVGFKKKEWRICTPVHPWCGDTLSRIYPDMQEFDTDIKRIKYKLGQEFEKHIPEDFVDELESERAKYRERQDILAKKRAESLLSEEKK